MAEAEHKKELLKRKSQCFDHLLEISKTAKCQGLKADSSTLYNIHASSPSPDSSQLPEREALATVHMKSLTSSTTLSSSSSSSSSGLLALTPSATCGSGSRSNSRTESPVSTEEARATSWLNCQPRRRMRLPLALFGSSLISVACSSPWLYCLTSLLLLLLLAFPYIGNKKIHCTFLGLFSSSSLSFFSLLLCSNT